jgi:tetratricopeptide (TPR) repeat protein
LKYLLLQFEVIWRYVLLLALPLSQSIVHDVRRSGMISLAGAAGLVVVTALVFRYRRRAPLAAFGVSWFLLLLVPSSSILPLQYPMAEHRVYLASAGLFLAAGAGVDSLLAGIRHRAAPLRWVVYTAGVLLLGALSGLTVARNAVWADPVTLWRDAAQKAPSIWQAHLSLGAALQEAGRCQEAVGAYEQAIRLAPRRQLSRAKLADCLLDLGRVEEAREVERTMRARDPEFAKLCQELRQVAQRLDGLQDCMERYQMRTGPRGRSGEGPHSG